FGSSPVVGYEGTGAYFLDKVRDGLWRVEVYPDQVMVRDPFEQPQPGKVVSRLLYRSWPMAIHLPDLGQEFWVTPIHIAAANASTLRRKATNSQFDAEPGVWVLSKQEKLDLNTLPSHIARVGFDEFHVNARQSYPDLIQSMAPAEFPAGMPIEIRVRIANDVL